MLVWLSFYQAVHADGCDIAFLIAKLNAFPFLQLLEVLVATAAVGSTNVERVANCGSRYENFQQLKEWKDVEIGYEKCDVTSISMDSLIEGKSYRLVVQRI